MTTMALKAAIPNSTPSDPAWFKVLLGLAAGMAPFYGGAMKFRNALYDRGILRAHSLGRPTISVGNISVGGTGKTPVVRWLAEKLSAAGEHPAILLRGYKPTPEGFSDEAQLLRDLLGDKAQVVPNPDRINGAASALSKNPQTSVFVLDDAMQHRRAQRNFDLVLINAMHPPGSDFVLPRGMLREPLSGLKRADAILLTHASETDSAKLSEIEATIRAHNANAPIFRADHVITGFRAASGEMLTVESVREKRLFAFCGLGSPQGFLHSLAAIGAAPVACRKYPDHHPYDVLEMEQIVMMAESNKADLIVTTEKDWVKFPHTTARPPSFDAKVVRAELALHFHDDGEQRLLAAITESVKKSASHPA